MTGQQGMMKGSGNTKKKMNEVFNHTQGIYIQDLFTWGLHSNQAGRTHSVVPECCGCSNTGLSGCDSILGEGRHGRYTHTAHSRRHQPGLNQSYLDGSVHSVALWSNLNDRGRTSAE